MKKRILSALLCCVMLLGLLPASAFAAGTGKAIQLDTGSITGHADTQSYDYIQSNDAHTAHCVCGGNAAEHEHESAPADWQPWDGTDEISYTDGSARVYLTMDASANLTVPSGSTLTLCLNGKAFRCADQSLAAITLDGGTLNLCDCVGTGTIGGRTSGEKGGSIQARFSTVNLYGGTLTGNSGLSRGGGISFEGGSFTMYGGAISGNSAQFGGGIFGGEYSSNLGGDAYINILGGEISGNTASQFGGGFYAATGFINLLISGGLISGNCANENGGGLSIAAGRYNITGGKIQNNSAGNQGGGIYGGNVNGTITGGEITGNTAKSGGGIYEVKGYSTPIAYYSDCKITGNSATEKGGGVYFEGSMSEMLVYGDLYISGNTLNGKPSNLCAEKSNMRYLIGDPMGENARIDISFTGLASGEIIRSSSVGNYYTTKADIAKFRSETEGFYIVASDEPDATYGYTGWLSVNSNHTHCICGGDVTAGDHESHTEQTFLPWSGGDAGYKNGVAYVYLKQDITLNSNLTVTNGNTLYLCLHGNTISSNGTNKIVVEEGSRLVICDCSGGGVIKGATRGWGGTGIYVYKSTLDIFGGKITGGKVTSGGGGGAIALDDKNCVLNIYGGEISGNNGRNSGGAIFLNDNNPNNELGSGTVNLYDGKICNNTATNGGAIYAVSGGTINLIGGEISGNTSNNDGGAVYGKNGARINITGTKITENKGRYGGAICLVDSCTLIMEKGEMSKNQATEGGAVSVFGTNSTFTLVNGSITDNSATDGGAIYLNQDNSILNMGGGTISGNTATGHGGAVYTYRDVSVMTMSGGTIENNTAGEAGGAIYINKGQLNLMDAPVIRNNTVSGNANNVYLKSGKMLTVYYFQSTEQIGVTTETLPTKGNPVVFCNDSDKDYSDYFFADDPNAHVEYNSDKQLQLAEGAAHTHVWSDDWSSDGTHHWHECTAEGCDITDNAQKDGYAVHYGEDDGNCTTAVNCEACGYEITAAQSDHSYPDTWTVVRPGTSHRRSCQNEGCGMTQTGNCVSDGKATCQEFAKCTICGGDCGTKADHSFTAENTDAQYLKSAATCTERALYYKSCVVCGLSSEGMADEDTFESGDIDASNHTGNIGDWQANSEKHWKEYSCCHAKVEEAAHDFDSDADTTCTTCGYQRSEVSFHSITVVGNGKDRGNWLNGANWDPADASNHMTETADAVYEITYTGIAASGDTNYEVKFAADDGWTDNWGAEDSTSLSGNAVYNAPGISFSVAKDNSTVKIVLDLSNYDYTTKEGATYAITITQSHTHTWSATWTYDETHHWHECTADGCDITENAAKDSYGAHIFDNDADPTCNTCGYIRTLTHTITFDANGGTVVGSTTAQTNTDGKLSSLPTATHFGSYFFDGWYTQRKGGTKITTDTVFSEDTTVYAHWTYINLNIGGSDSRYDYCTIRATAGDNGSLSPVGNVSVREGKDQIFTITPDTGYVVSDVLVDGRSIGAVTSYTFTNVRSDHTIEALFEKEESDIPQTLPFMDVAEDAYYYDAVLWAVENGITSGTDDVHFTPDAPCTRAQIVTFLWRAAGEPVVNYAMQMDDVAEDAYYAEAVRWALSCGITTGATETTFRPDDECTRAQAVVFLFRYAAICGMDAVTLQELVSGYADADSVPDYALPAMNWALAAGIVQGDGTNLMPNAGCTRGQIVTFLWRTLVK